jgi:hypothetical protein
MFKPRGLLIVGVLLLLSAPAAFAEPISFETSFATEGWETLGNVQRVGPVGLPIAFPSVTVNPTDGLVQALLGTDGFSWSSDSNADGIFEVDPVAASYVESFFGVTSGSLTTPDANGNFYTRGSGLKREFVLGAGDTVTFDWTFVSGETVQSPDAPFNDAAYFISNVGTQELLSTVFMAGGLVGSTNSGTFTATVGGTYSLGVGIFDQTDQFDLGVSYITVDNFNIHQSTGEVGPTPVPEPGTLLMLMGGFGAVFTARRYRVN